LDRGDGESNKLRQIYICAPRLGGEKKDYLGMDPWYKVTTPRKEVREGRSFNPDEFAIALEQVVARIAPEGPNAVLSRCEWARTSETSEGSACAWTHGANSAGRRGDETVEHNRWEQTVTSDR